MQVVDANALANSIVQGVFARIDVNGQGQQPANRQERVSAFKATADKLLASEKIDKDVMPVMLELLEAMGTDLTEKQSADFVKSAQQQQTKAIHDELGRLVARYGATCPNPELITALKDKIVQDAINDYNSDGNLVAQYQRSGQVDWNRMDKTVVEYVTKWAGKAGAAEVKPAGGPAMKNSAPSGAIETSHELDKESLSEGRQREMFNSQVGFGIKEMRLDRNAAEKRALELVNKAEAKVRSGKR
jgi:hypothetical protein